jgi:RNA polymerase sigma-70 factor (ECF subfamily)
MGSSKFPMTRWSVVLSARGGDASMATLALSELCEVYWMPLYSFARRTGKSAEDAEDLTQAFFARLIEKDLFSKANAERGKLRSFLLGAFKNFLSDEWDKSRALKRGGGNQ